MKLARKRYKVDRNDNNYERIGPEHTPNQKIRTTHTPTCHIQDEQVCVSSV